MTGYLNFLVNQLHDQFSVYRNPDLDVALYDQEQEIAKRNSSVDKSAVCEDKPIVAEVAKTGIFLHENRIKRIAASMLPFLSLYHPVGIVFSAGSSSLRVLTNVHAVFSCDSKQKAFYPYMLQAALGTVSLAGMFFHFKICLLTTNAADTLHSAIKLGKIIKSRPHKEQLIKDALQLLAAVSFSATLISGSLEIVLASYLILRWTHWAGQLFRPNLFASQFLSFSH